MSKMTRKVLFGEIQSIYHVQFSQGLIIRHPTLWIHILYYLVGKFKLRIAYF